MLPRRLANQCKFGGPFHSRNKGICLCVDASGRFLYDELGKGA